MSFEDDHPGVSPPGPAVNEPTPRDPAEPASPGNGEPEVPAGIWSRFALASLPFVLLVAFFLADRWIRG
jgi:hypothetical protein